MQKWKPYLLSLLLLLGGVAAAQESDRCYQLYGGLTYSLDETAIKESSVYPTGGLFLSADCLAHSFSHAVMIEFNIGYKI